MNWRIRLAASARRDIAAALRRTLDEFGERQHEIYVSLIANALQRIATDPKGRGAKKRDALHPNARTFHIAQRGKRARHFFLYRVNDDNTVDVARFLHDAMELSRHVPDRLKAEDD